jgi:hypothetical protein
MKNIKYLKIKTTATLLGLFTLIFLASLVVSASAASTSTTINSTISSVISVTSTGSVTLNVLPTGSGSQTIGSDTVTVNTNDIDGYNLTLASSSASSAALVNQTNNSYTIPASSGSQASPANPEAVNTWGYCVSSIGNFATCPANVNNSSTIYGKFAGVPLSGSPATIATSSTTATNATTTVTYAVNANSSQPSGLYEGTVNYTATANI